MSKRRAYLGGDSVHYAENSAGHVYLTTPGSPLKEGFVRKVADTVPQVEWLWKKLDEQERVRLRAIKLGRDLGSNSHFDGNLPGAWLGRRR